MKCKKCGYKNEKVSEVCAECGNSLKKEKSSKGLSVIIITLSVIAVLLAGIMIYMICSPNNNVQNNSESNPDGGDGAEEIVVKSYADENYLKMLPMELTKYENSTRGYNFDVSALAVCEMEEYSLEKGILNYKFADFDSDGEEELLVVEVRDENELYFSMWQLEDDTMVCMDEVSVCSVLNEVAPTSFDGTTIFVKEHEGEYYIFSEQYIYGGLVNDGCMIYIKGYKLSETFEIVVDIKTGGSAWLPEESEPYNEQMKEYGLAPVIDVFYGDDKSIADVEGVDKLVRIVQMIDAKNFHEYTYPEIKAEKVKDAQIMFYYLPGMEDIEFKFKIKAIVEEPVETYETQTVNYKEIYLNYAKDADENDSNELSDVGEMILLDLNSDDVPELLAFSTSVSHFDEDGNKLFVSDEGYDNPAYKEYSYTIEKAFSIIDGKVVADSPWKHETHTEAIIIPFLPDEEVMIDTEAFCNVVQDKNGKKYLAAYGVLDWKGYITMLWYDVDGFGYSTKYDIDYDDFELIASYKSVDLPVVSGRRYDEENKRKLTHREAMENLLNKYENAF